MRKFKLHTYDRSRTFDLNTASAFATEPSGLGNAFSPSYKESDSGKHLTNITPSFPPITFKIIFNADGSKGYENYKSLLLFLASCGTSKILLEYDDGVTDKFCDVILKSATKSERGEDGIFCETFTFERQSYWYEEISSIFYIKTESGIPTFPLSFPFAFAGTTLANYVRISNPFFEASPVTIKIKGYVEDRVQIYVKDASTDEIIAECEYRGEILAGETVVIDPITKKVTVTSSNGVVSNGYDNLSKNKQTFLYLPFGEYLISSNITSNVSGNIEVSVKRYLYD